MKTKFINFVKRIEPETYITAGIIVAGVIALIGIARYTAYLEEHAEVGLSLWEEIKKSVS